MLLSEVTEEAEFGLGEARGTAAGDVDVDVVDDGDEASRIMSRARHQPRTHVGGRAQRYGDADTRHAHGSVEDKDEDEERT